jgi:hypothetical protein
MFLQEGKRPAEAEPKDALNSAAMHAAVGGRETTALACRREFSLRGVCQPVSAWRLA